MNARALSPRRRYSICPDRVAPVFATLPIEVQAVLRLCDGTRSVKRLGDDSGLPARQLERVLYKLEQLGYVEQPRLSPVEHPKRTAPSAHAPTMTLSIGHAVTLRMPIVVEHDFTPDEEAFFARPIDHLLEEGERSAQSA